MPRPNVIVAGIHSLDPPRTGLVSKAPPGAAPDRLAVSFEGGHVVSVDPGNEMSATHASVLGRLFNAGLPAYVELDAKSGMISDVQIPVTGRVVKMTPAADGSVRVAMDGSPRLFRLPRSNPLFAEFDSVLTGAAASRAPVIVTEDDDTGEILDVRLAQNPSAPASPEAAGLAPADQPRLKPVTMRRATELFNLVSAQSCDPRTGVAPCIPFLYPRDGCHARAHQMCRLILAEGERPGKVFNFGTLQVSTPNEPHCEAVWWFHVAPVLQVTVAGLADPPLYVVDPALFSEPVPMPDWLAVQRDPGSRQAVTSPVPYVPVSAAGGFEDDPTYSNTMTELERCLAALRRRCGAHGPPPPPYAACL